MTLFAMIRHGPTDWNAGRRVQGHVDRPLDDAGRALVAKWRLPPGLRDFRRLSSPLRRAVETAGLLGGEAAPRDDRLIEMSWGAWEGRTLTDLRRELGDEMAANEDGGLDFRPAGGESPRDVQQRLAPLLAEIAARGEPTLAVTHKGVIRATWAWALDWDMRGKPPIKFDWSSAHLLQLAADGRPLPVRANLTLLPE